MSTTIEDVDVRLTATRNELMQEDVRLWEGLEDEKISRIAGDEANKQFTQLVQDANQGTESRLSTEVIHRSEGDLNNINSLTALAQALSDYRIKTDLEISNEIIAREALGVQLNSRIDNFVASWDHDKFLIYRTIQEVQDDVDGKYQAMDVRITKYEQMLSDITMDSIQITMDNGEINMGAWTILSQAREWDLEIIAGMKNFQHKTEEDLNQALEDIQNKLPVEQDIIDKAIEALSNAPIIKELDEKLTGAIGDIDDVHKELLDEVINRQNEMVAQAQNTADELKKQSDELNASVTAEANARIEGLQREAAIREDQMRQEAEERSAEIDAKITEVNVEVGEVFDAIKAEETARIAAINSLNDGLTAEIQHRKDGDQVITTALENYKSSNDTALANVRTELAANVTATTANATKIDALDVRLTTNETETGEAKALAASATQKAETALTETSALSSQMTTVNASIEGIKGDLANKADAAAFNQLKAEVTELDGKVTTNTQDLTALKTSVTGLNNTVTGHTSAISKLETTQVTQGNQLTQLSQDTTILQNTVSDIQEDMATKVDSTAFNQLSTKVDKNANDITAQSTELTRLNNSLVTTNQKVDTKADASALNTLSSKVETIDGKVTSNTTAITNLNSKMTTVEEDLATKLDADVLNAYSTTVQMNSAIAEGITTYDANLEIGGENLYLGPNPITLSGRAGELNVVTDAVSVSQLFKYLTADELDMTQLAVGTKTVSSMEFYIPSSTNNNFEFRFAIYRFSGTQYVQTAVIKASECPRDKWFRITLDEGVLPATAVAASNINISVYVYRRYIGDTIKWRNLMMEKGTKASAYSEPTSVLKKNITANANAVQTVSAKVENIDGRVTSNSNALTTLTNRVTTVESDVTKKADATAVNALTSRVETAEGQITSQGNAVTKLQNDLVITNNTANAALPRITQTTSNYKQFRNVLNYYRGAVTTANLVIETPITISAKMSEIAIKGYLYNGKDTSLDLRVGFYAYRAGTPFLNTSFSSLGSYPVNVRLGVKEDKVVIILTSKIGSFSYPQFGLDAAFAYSLAPDTWASGWRCVEVAEAELSTQGITYITQLDAYNPKESIEANATALQTLDNKVTQNGNDIASISTAQTALTNRVTTVENGLTNKADSSAVQQLDSRVTTAEGKITTNATAITNLQNRVTTAEGNITATNSAVSGLTTRVTATENGLATQTTQSTKLTAAISSISEGLKLTGTADTIAQSSRASDAKFLLVAEPSAASGYVLRLGNDSGGNDGVSMLFQQTAPIDANKLYRVRYRYRRVAGTGSIYLGISPLTADKLNGIATNGALMSPTAVGSMHYFVANQTPALNTWEEGVYYFKGKAPDGTNSAGSGTVASPRTFTNKAAFMRIGVLPNFTNQSGIQDIDYIIIEDADAIVAADANATAITETRAEVTRIDGVVKSHTSQLTSLQTEVAGKANSSAVTSLESRVTATEGNVTSLSNQTTTLTNRMTAAEGKITGNTTAISTLDNKVTEVDGRVTSQSTALTKVQSDLSGMLIGGANLWSLQATGRYSGGVVTAPHAQVSVSGNVVTFTNKDASSRIGCNVPLTSGQPVTVRFKPITGVTDGVIYFRALTATGSQADSQKTYTAVLKDGYYSVTIPSTQLPSNTASVNFGLGGAGAATTVVSEITIQVGNTATAWTDSYRDIPEVDLSEYAKASAVTALDTKVQTIDGKVTSQANLITQLQSDVAGNSAKLVIQGEVVDGLKASYVVKTDVNGLVAGYGLYNTGSTSAFGVNADFFYVGKGTAAANGKKPFMVLTTPTTIGGVTYPAGTWIDVALIANATIGTAHIADASITNAKIKDLDASKITTGVLNANRVRVGPTSTFDDGYNPTTKARTFVAQPTVPYSVGDIWKNGTSTYICKTQRVAGSFTASEWDKVGDVTSENTAANANQLGGTPAATINTNIANADTKAGNAQTLASNADAKATTAQSTANTANNQVNAWKFTGTTNIDGGNIQADTVTAAQISVNELSAISGNLGTLTSTSPKGTTTMTGSLIEVRDSSGQLRVKLGVW